MSTPHAGEPLRSAPSDPDTASVRPGPVPPGPVPPSPVPPGPVPPGPVPPASAPTALAIAAVVLAGLVTVLELVTAVAAVPATDRFTDAIRAGDSGFDTFTTYDLLEMALLPLMLAAWVVTSLWLGEARYNTVRLSPHLEHRRGRAWVWLGWVVPIVSWWFPFQVVRDVQAASSVRRRPVGLGGWWTAWLVYLTSTQAASRMASSSDLDIVRLLPAVEAIAATAAVVGFALWARIVRSITAAQADVLDR